MKKLLIIPIALAIFSSCSTSKLKPAKFYNSNIGFNSKTSNKNDSNGTDEKENDYQLLENIKLNTIANNKDNFILKEGVISESKPINLKDNSSSSKNLLTREKSKNSRKKSSIENTFELHQLADNKNSIKAVHNKTLAKSDVINNGGDDTTLVIAGFLLGFFLGLIGVLLAYIFSNNPAFRSASWKGFGVWLILLLIILLL